MLSVSSSVTLCDFTSTQLLVPRQRSGVSESGRRESLIRSTEQKIIVNTWDKRTRELKLLNSCASAVSDITIAINITSKL